MEIAEPHPRAPHRRAVPAIRRPRGRARRASYFPAILLATFLGAVWSLMAFDADGYGRTLLLYAFTVTVGMILIHRTARVLGDPNLTRLAYIFLAKLAILLLLLAPSWNVALIGDTPLREGDQLRFYYQAFELAQSGFSLSALPSLNYTGVLFVYGALFVAFGHNVFVAPMANSLLALLMTLLLVRVAYRVKPKRDPGDWTIGLVMVIPEVLLHDVMTSRDALVMSLLSIAVLAVANYLLAGRFTRRLLNMLMLAAPSLLLLAAVRTTALIPAIAAIVLLLLVFRSQVNFGVMVLVAAAALALLVTAPRISLLLGGYQFQYAQILSAVAFEPTADFLSTYQWSERSIGRLLVPQSTIGAVVLTVPRVIAYLAIPLPTIGVDWGLFFARDWVNFQQFLIVSSSIVYVALFPLALVALYNAVKRRDATLAINVPFWLIMIAVASGTAILHERYRVMAVPFLWACLWLGRSARTKQIVGAYLLWGGILLSGAMGLFFYKLVSRM